MFGILWHSVLWKSVLSMEQSVRYHVLGILYEVIWNTTLGMMCYYVCVIMGQRLVLLGRVFDMGQDIKFYMFSIVEQQVRYYLLGITGQTANIVGQYSGTC